MTDLFPPFEPGDEPNRRRFKPVPMRVLLPNVITLLSLCAGLTAMRLAVEGKLENMNEDIQDKLEAPLRQAR
jgi:CDP-diacylglycerol--serine O-phosphatidyltransferase